MERQPKILVFGGISVDLVFPVGSLPAPGGRALVHGFRAATGGKGANQAAQCSLLGADVSLVGRVGNDAFGHEALQSLQQLGVDISCVSRDSAAATGVSCVVIESPDSGSQKRTLAAPGANLNLTMSDVEFLQESLPWYDMLLLQQEVPMGLNELVSAYAKAAGVPVVLTPAPSAPLSSELLRGLAYLCPNVQQAAYITGVPIHADEKGVNLDDVKAATAVLLSAGVENVLITLGVHGAVLADSHGSRYTPCVPPEPMVDHTAAMDSFVGGFCTALTFGQSQETAMIYGSHTAALSASRWGAVPSLPTLAEVQSFIERRGCGTGL